MRRLRACLLLCFISTVLPLNCADSTASIPEVARLPTEVIRIIREALAHDSHQKLKRSESAKGRRLWKRDACSST
jgi:hypothetical protein